MKKKEQIVFPWGHTRRFNDFSTHFRRLFTGRVQKISINAGFTCPNRDGSRGVGGCTYCNNQTFSPTYCNLEHPVLLQLQHGVDFFAKKYPDMQYLAYFQSYTNTYAPFDHLIKLYEEALQFPDVIGLVVSTRPDCVDGYLLDYFARLSEKKYVMIEYGVESHKNETLAKINRGHTFEESVNALTETAKRNIRTCAHMILGLPDETRNDFLEQAAVVSQLPLQNLKLHQLQIHKNSVMGHQYLQNAADFTIFSIDEYVELIVDYLELLNPSIIAERFTSESPDNLLIAPRWGLKNFEFVAKVDKRLKERNSWQGRLFNLF